MVRGMVLTAWLARRTCKAVVDKGSTVRLVGPLEKPSQGAHIRSVGMDTDAFGDLAAGAADHSVDAAATAYPAADSTYLAVAYPGQRHRDIAYPAEVRPVERLVDALLRPLVHLVVRLPASAVAYPVEEPSAEAQSAGLEAWVWEVHPAEACSGREHSAEVRGAEENAVG